MENSGLSASDVLALTRNNDDMFGGTGGFILLFIFLMALSGNGFGWGNNGTATALGQSDLQNSLYFQSQDNAIRGISSQLASVNDSVLMDKYDNALLMKDVSQQLSNSIAGISNQISNQTLAMQEMFNQAQIRDLADKLATTRDELSNTRQTAVITNAISQQTQDILNAQGKYYLNPPCYNTCCGGNSLY